MKMTRDERIGTAGGGAPQRLAPQRLAPQRLIDGRDVDPGSLRGQAIDLLRVATPYQARAGRKQRVQIALAALPARRSRLLLRPAVIVAVLIGGGAVGSAALGRWPRAVVEVYQRLVPPAATVDPAGAKERRSAHRRGSASAAPSAIPEGMTSAVGEPALAALPAPVPAPPLPTVAPPAPTHSSAVPSSKGPVAVPAPRARRAGPPASAEDTTPVLAAMRALRRDHDPARARGLLATYLAQHPSGALAEEALALSIEAAVAHRDGDAGALAQRYLRLYPSGPFSALARRTLATDLHRQ
jgi:hypothetical protein